MKNLFIMEIIITDVRITTYIKYILKGDKIMKHIISKVGYVSFPEYPHRINCPNKEEHFILDDNNLIEVDLKEVLDIVSKDYLGVPVISNFTKDLILHLVRDEKISDLC